MSGTGTFISLSVEEFREIKGVLVDVRSPAEFKKGHWPGANNLPIFTDEEREIIGKTYKCQGREKAISIGLEMTVGKLSELKEMLEKISTKKTGFLKSSEELPLKIYCWRGGMRSSSISWLARQLNIKSVLLNSGYKQYRNWVINQFDKFWNIKVIGGKTGTGKTELLENLSLKGMPILDLEGLANHRGSSFGALGLPLQPTSQQYENLIAEKLEALKNNTKKVILIEDESSNLGKCRIPKALLEQMKNAPLIEIIKSKDERISHLVKIYSKHSKYDLKEATRRISKRLGSERTKLTIEAIEKENWRQACFFLLDYYDRCYEYQLSRSPNRKSIDLKGLDLDEAAEKFMNKSLYQ